MPSSKQKPIDVSIRIKPFLTSSSSHPTTTTFVSKQSVEEWIVDKSQPFATKVWTTKTSQFGVYNDFMHEQFLPSFEAGLNCTCFLYGQTGSGKTYTLFGPPDHFQVSASISPSLSSSSSTFMESEHPTYWGIFPRCISYFLPQ